MKDQLLKMASLLILLVPVKGSSQLPYTYTSAIPPHSSREFRVWENLELNGDTIGIITTGTDVVWDLTDISLNEPFEHTIYFEPSSATPFHNMYPQANVVQWETDQFTGNADYNYFNNSPFELRLLGGVHVSDGQPEMIEFCPDPFLIMDYPMSIGSGVQQVYSCEESNGEIDNWVIMATGRVIFNGGSIDDLVLWRSTFTGPNFAQKSYFWTQMDNMLYPVVRYLPGTHLKIREPISQTALGIENASSNAFPMNVHPNPATGSITLQAPADLQNARILIRDASGRVVQEATGSAMDRVTLDVASLAPGTYIIETITTSNKRSRMPFMKQ